MQRPLVLPFIAFVALIAGGVFLRVWSQNDEASKIEVTDIQIGDDAEDGRGAEGPARWFGVDEQENDHDKDGLVERELGDKPGTKRLGGQVRVLGRKEFLDRLKKLGFKKFGRGFDAIHDQRDDLASLVVLVTNPDNVTVRGAKVFLDQSKTNQSFHINGSFSPDVIKGRSGSDGIAQFKNLAVAPHLLAVAHGDYLTGYFGSIPLVAGEQTYVEAVLETPSATISGTVTTSNGTPIEAVLVAASHYTEGGVPFAGGSLTAFDGAFSIGVREGTQSTVIASKLGYKDTQLDGVVAGSENLRIVLEETKTVFVSGFVTKGNSIDPVQDFSVDSDRLFHPEGVFRVERNVKADPTELVFSADGYEPRVITVDLSDERDVDIGQVALYGGRELNGIVLLEEEEGGERIPVAMASVTVVTDSGNSQSALTTESGLFSFTELATEKVQITVVAPGVEPYNREVTLLEDEPTYLEVVLQPGEFNVTGKIIDDDTEEAIEGVLVTVVERPELVTTTDANGDYEILGIALAQFSLVATKEGYEDETSPSLAGSEEGAVWNGRLKPKGLRVALLSNGQALPAGVTAILWKEIVPTVAAAQVAQSNLASHRFAVLTNEDGVAVFDVEDGNYFLQVPNYRLHPTKIQVDTEDSASLTVSVPGLTQLQGQVRNADGSPVANTSVWLHSGDQDYSTMFLYHTDAQGNYSIPNLSPKSYALSIIKSVADQSAQHVREFNVSGASTQTFNVGFPTLTSKIRGRLTDGNGAGKPGVKIGVEYLDANHRSILAGWVTTDSQGNYTVPRLEPGSHRVRTAWTDHVAVYSDPVVLAPGETKVVDLVAPAIVGAHIQGSVIANDGGPIGPNFLFVRDNQGRQNGNFFSTMDWAYIGVFDIKSLSPGSHNITVTAMGAKKKLITAFAGNQGLQVQVTREN